MSKDIWAIISGVIILGIIYMLARPGSPAATAIQQVSDALTALVQTSTGYTVGGQTQTA
jgi:hypothetical protein